MFQHVWKIHCVYDIFLHQGLWRSWVLLSLIKQCSWNGVKRFLKLTNRQVDLFQQDVFRSQSLCKKMTAPLTFWKLMFSHQGWREGQRTWWGEGIIYQTCFTSRQAADRFKAAAVYPFTSCFKQPGLALYQEKVFNKFTTRLCCFTCWEFFDLHPLLVRVTCLTTTVLMLLKKNIVCHISTEVQICHSGLISYPGSISVPLLSLVKLQ